jgi:hypothetical protein
VALWQPQADEASLPDDLARPPGLAGTRRHLVGALTIEARRERASNRPPIAPAPFVPRHPYHPSVPPIDEIIRIEPIYLGRLERQGIFTTGLLLEVTETPTRRQTLADQVDASTNDVLMWRDEAQMLNLAGFGPAEHRLLSQGGFEGLKDILEVDLDTFRKRLARAADELKMDPPTDLTVEGWWDQAHTLAE